MLTQPVSGLLSTSPIPEIPASAVSGRPPSHPAVSTVGVNLGVNAGHRSTIGSTASASYILNPLHGDSRGTWVLAASDCSSLLPDIRRHTAVESESGRAIMPSR